MGLFDESEEWILYQEGDGPNPEGEPGCLESILAVIVVIVFVIIVMLIIKE